MRPENAGSGGRADSELLTSAWNGLSSWLPAGSGLEWAALLSRAADDALVSVRHGQQGDWAALLKILPTGDAPCWGIEDGRVAVEAPGLSDSDRSRVADALMRLRPWRKGPFQIAGTFIDSEWRSDWKWDRIAGCTDWRHRRVLDVGCGNGYFGWRMLAAGAESVLGLEPFLLYVVQHAAVRRLADPASPHAVVPLTDGCLQTCPGIFDPVVSMGVLYHRTGPVDHLLLLRNALKPGGVLILETLIIDDPEPRVLVPQDRYARMRNVWFIPSVPLLTRWLQRTGFRDVEVVDITPTTVQEQRSTDWMTFESLADCLSPHDPSRTVEGWPAPLRAVVRAVRPPTGSPREML